MTMKKRFLGLALAAMVAVPATTAYATDKTITGNDTQTLNHTVKVSGTINNNDGIAPEGTLTVEVPTAMAFTVDEKGNFSAPTYNITNKSAKGITVSVKEFRDSTPNGGITLETLDSFDQSQKDRSHIALLLNGRAGGLDVSVDLSEVDPNGDAILDLRSGETGMLSLTGVAGEQASTDQENGVDKKGAKENFDLGTYIISK